MSNRGCATPRLRKYLSDKNLLQYAKGLDESGFGSVETISCLPEDEDITFIQELNVNSTLDRIKLRTVFNQIRKDVNHKENIAQTMNTNVIDLTALEPKSEPKS
eukprot:252776_1